MAFHREVPVVDKFPGPPFSDSASAYLANVLLLSAPDVDRCDFWGPRIGPDWSSAESGHQRASKRRDGGRVRGRTERLPIGSLNAVPRNGMGPDQGF